MTSYGGEVPSLGGVPAGNWDQYADPAAQSPNIFPAAGGDGYPGRDYIFVHPDGTVTRLPRVLQRLRSSHTFVGGNGGGQIR